MSASVTPRRAAVAHRASTPRTSETIAFLVGESAHRVLHYMTAEWAAALESLGQPTVIIDVAGPHGLDLLGNYLDRERPRAICAFGGVGSDLRVDGRSLYEVIGVPYVALLFDHPAYFPERHAEASRFQAYLFSDPDHLEASRALSPAGALRGRFRFGCAPPTVAPRPLDRRDIPLLLAKNGGDPETVRRYWNGFPPAFRRVCDDVLDLALWSTDEPIWGRVQRRIADDGLLAGFERTPGFTSMVMSLDTYIRRMRATRLAQALLRFDALIVGGDWAHLDRTHARATFRPGCELPELLALMDRSRIVANLHPNNRYVPHERLIYGMQRECIVLSESSMHLAESIGARRFAPFAWSESLEDQIADLMRDPSRHQNDVREAGIYAREVWSVGAGAASVRRAVDTYIALLAE